MTPVALPEDVLRFFELVFQTDLELAFEPADTPTQPDSPDTPLFVVAFQHPTAGTLIAEDTTVVLQFQATPNV